MHIAESTRSVAIESSCPVFLEVHEQDQVRVFGLTHAGLRIGSNADNDIRLQDATVSARHAAVVWDAGAYWVVDAGSKNGTYAGGARVERAKLLSDAVVGIGGATLVARASELDLPDGGTPLPGVAGRSACMLRLASEVRRLAKLRHPVLILGETGTGKELIARALHEEGPRVSHAFVPLNVANLPRDLVETELFGHERGAFTGALSARRGAFAEAHRGTLFLDEVGELAADAQPKLLRVLDGYGARRLGADGPSRAEDVRVITATHVPLLDAVRRGSFRRDLYHRLEVHVLTLAPLRARKADIPAVARMLLSQFDREQAPRLSASALAQLVAHRWPGNIRELRNVLFRAAGEAMSEGVIRGGHVRQALSAYALPTVELTQDAAERCFREYGANLSRAARAAGVPRTTFRRRLEGAKPSP